MAELLRGGPVADAITDSLVLRVQALRSRGIEPCLAILRVGERVDDLSYECAALKRCGKVGIRVRQLVLPDSCTQHELTAAVDDINRDRSIHACLMFRPLPPHLDEPSICERLLPEKDVDCMTPRSLAAVFSGKWRGYAPCTAQSCLELLDYYGIDPAGKNVTVIGRSLVIGKPVSMLLQNRNATVTTCHTRTADTAGICRHADILIVAAGKPGFVDERFTHSGQIILDVGVNAAPGGGICGDVKFDSVSPIARAVSPVPGGVGSVTTAVLCKHILEASEASVS